MSMFETLDYAVDFNLNAFNPDILGEHPAAAGCVVWEGEVGPGDMIFIPSRWPHAVVNLEAGIAIR